MTIPNAERTEYVPPVITRVRLEDKSVVAQTACKDSIETTACAQIILDEFGNPIKTLPAFDFGS